MNSLKAFLTLTAVTVTIPVLAEEQSANIFAPIVQTREYLEPFIPRPDQDRETEEKLSALEKRFGRKPNIVILLVDDMSTFTTLAAAGAPDVVETMKKEKNQ